MIFEIRTYRLKVGAGDEFVRLVRDEAVPLLEEFGIRVVSYGVSLVGEGEHRDGYLIRAFPSLDARAEQERRFYGSSAWRDGPRSAILSIIDGYHTVVVDAWEPNIGN